MKLCVNPVNCAVSDWSDWSPCTDKCGGGQTYRQRMVRYFLFLYTELRGRYVSLYSFKKPSITLKRNLSFHFSRSSTTPNTVVRPALRSS